MKKIFALLVGINDYPAPLTRLNGCLNDVRQIEAYLLEHFGAGEEAAETSLNLPIRSFGPLNICRLENEQATHRRIVYAFRIFLRRAGPDDAVWFHFSGHGSEEFTAEAFLALEPNGKDQTLVCFQRSEEDGPLHLADKELAVLLHEVATQDTGGLSKKSPHLVVSLDCCHSGSGTRDLAAAAQLKTRSISPGISSGRIKARLGTVTGRPLDSYLSGYFSRQRQQQDQLELPLTRHILLSACESIQKAGDLPGGGIFTTTLLKTLKAAGGWLNYADLFVRTRAESLQLRHQQTPQFETIGNFDPYTRFLEGSPLGTPERYALVHQGAHWYVGCGAIHGLPIDRTQEIELEILSAAPESRSLGSAMITAIGAQKSRIAIAEGLSLQKGQHYQAAIRRLPAPAVLVHLTGDAAGVQLLKQRRDSSKNVQWTERPEVAQLEVETGDGVFHIRDLRSGRHIHSRSREPADAGIVLDALWKIVKWERTVRLDNPRSAIRQHVDLELKVGLKDGSALHFTAPAIRLYARPDTYYTNTQSSLIGAAFTPCLIVRHPRQDLYAYLLHLRPNYGIEAYEVPVVFRPAEHPGKAPVIMPMWKKPLGWGLSGGEDEAVCYFKLLVTTEALDYQQLLQAGIDGFRDAEGEWNPLAEGDDWCSCTIKVSMLRAEEKLSPDRPVILANGRMRLQPHPAIQGRVSLTAATADLSGQLLRLQSPSLRLLDFRLTGAPMPAQVLEISDLFISSQAAFSEKPFTISIAEQTQLGQYILAIAFDGRNFRLLAQAEAAGGAASLEFRELPDVLARLPAGEDLTPDPFNPEDWQHRSLYETLRIGFFKLDLGRAAPGQFRWVDLSLGASDLLQQEGIPEKVAAAGRIVVLLPAVITGAAQWQDHLTEVLSARIDELRKGSDLVLVFDLHAQSGEDKLFSLRELERISVQVR